MNTLLNHWPLIRLMAWVYLLGIWMGGAWPERMLSLLPALWLVLPLVWWARSQSAEVFRAGVLGATLALAIFQGSTYFVENAEPRAVQDFVGWMVIEDVTHVGDFHTLVRARSLASPTIRSMLELPNRDWHAGDRLQAGWVLQPLSEQELTPGFAQYLARLRVRWWGEPNGGIDEVLPASAWSWPGIRRSLEQRIQRLWPEPEASLMAGLLIGIENDLPDPLEIALSRTGTSHIIAISGFNVSLVLLLVGQLLMRVLPRRERFWVVSLAIAGFVLLVGASASVVRAGWMAWLVLAAGQSGRRVAADHALWLAAVVMVVLSPGVLWQLGFQLSLLATLGILWCHAPIDRGLRWIYARVAHAVQIVRDSRMWPETLLQYLHETLAVTLAAQVLVLPLLLASFGELSLIAPLANVLVLFAVPGAMLLGVVTLVVDTLLPWLVAWVALLGQAWVSYLIGMVMWLGGLPWASVSVMLPAWGAGVFYLLLGGVAWRVRWRRSPGAG